MDNPSDTFFTLSPEWGWLVVLYFFVGGIAGGAAFLAAMLDLFGTPTDRPMARLGYLISLPLIALGGILLIVDLTRPERFWHMFIKSESGGLMFKSWSPISFGAWAVNLFALFCFLAFIGVLAEVGVLPDGLKALRTGGLGQVISAVTGLLGLFLAGYTGILLATTNRPLWGDSTLLGLLFLVSGISAAAALMTLLGRPWTSEGSVDWLSHMDFWSLVLELVVLVVLAISLGSVASELWGNAWGALLVIGVIGLGILVPLALHWRPRLLGRMSVPSAAALVLIGGFLLRTVIILSSEAA